MPNNRAQGRKKSLFPGSTTIPAGATFDFVAPGVNYKILIEDMIAGLGVTGTIVQDGALTGTPVLDTQGSVNNIRNLEDGPGVKASVSPENGITLEHNFTADTGGVPILIDADQIAPKIRSITAGAGINVSSTNGSIQIALSSTPVSTKTVIVTQMSDFPAAVGGVIALDDDTEYAILNDLTTSSRFVLGNNTVLSGSDNAVVSLTYDNTGIMFTSVNKTWKIKGLTINCASGEFVHISGTASNVFQLSDCVVVANTLGEVNGMGGMQIDGVQFQVTTGGFIFSGAIQVALIEDLLTTISAGTMFSLGAAVFNALSFDNNFTTLAAGTTFLSGLAGSGNIAVGGLGTLHNSRFFGSGAALSGIADGDIRWQFFINDTIPDTHQDGMVSLSGNLTATTITAALTPVKIAGTWAVEHQSYFTCDTTGRCTYNGVKDTHVDITASFSGAPVSGTNKLIDFYAALNGSHIPKSGALNNLSAGDISRTTVVWRVTLSPGDYIEVFVENESDATDVLVTDAVLRVS